MKTKVFFALYDSQLLDNNKQRVQLPAPFVLTQLNVIDCFMCDTFDECLTQFYPSLAQGESINICKAEIEYKCLVDGLNSAIHGNTYSKVPVTIIDIIRLSREVELDK